MDDLSQLIQQASDAHAQGDLGLAERLYAQALAQNPARVDASAGMAVLLSQTGRHAQALQHYPREVVLNSSSTMLLVGLAGSLLAENHSEEALPFLEKALQVDPTCPEAHNTLGAAHLAQGRMLEAVMSLKAALRHRPAYPEAYYNLGRTLYASDMPADAVVMYDRALQLRPSYAQSYLNKGFALRQLGDLDGAAETFRQALTVRPTYAEAMHNLAVTLAEQGQAAEGIAWLKRAVETDPTNMYAHSALVYLMLFNPASTQEAIDAELALWNQRHAAALAPADPLYEVSRDPHRQLRIGFVSPDFRAHAEARFMLPLLAEIDSTQYEVHCYSSVQKPDDITRRMQLLAHVWHDVRGLSDAALADRITRDRIDILVDLTMHMENHRLLTFARRPAPLQISWLAYPGRTGLSTMDYHLSDRALHPQESTGDEKPLLLPDAWFCYQRAEEVPDVSPLPALSTGTITFGCLNTFRKISPQVLNLWARILQAMQAANRPARLLLITPEGSHRQSIYDLFASHGITKEHLELLRPMPYAEYMATCRHIDIALDPFPHAGATTTLDLFTMGLPVLSLRGNLPCGRLGETILSATNLLDWLATSEEEYLGKALAFASDLPRLANLRASLRQRTESSPITNAPRFARNFQHALRSAWHTWCEHG